MLVHQGIAALFVHAFAVQSCFLLVHGGDAAASPDIKVKNSHSNRAPMRRSSAGVLSAQVAIEVHPNGLANLMQETEAIQSTAGQPDPVVTEEGWGNKVVNQVQHEGSNYEAVSTTAPPAIDTTHSTIATPTGDAAQPRRRRRRRTYSTRLDVPPAIAGNSAQSTSTEMHHATSDAASDAGSHQETTSMAQQHPLEANTTAEPALRTPPWWTVATLLSTNSWISQTTSRTTTHSPEYITVTSSSDTTSVRHEDVKHHGAGFARPRASATKLSHVLLALSALRAMLRSS
mmetsp:Transcript_44777/g.106294  ORF Transcript_44777/g.106294 Transcript_44777/m.106294 type:complete len:288 (+) Transcript_44777:101-964(+)